MTAATLRVLETELVAYRRHWRGNVISTLVIPVIFLSAIGLGLGTLIDRGGQLDGLAYVTFYASGLLAAQAMQTGAGDGAFPVMAGLEWVKSYHAALLTPVTPGDIALGHLGFVAVRLTVASIWFAVVSALFGAFGLLRGLAAVPIAVLCGLAFAAVTMAYAATWTNDRALISLFRFGLVPMFLLSGVFFPITQLPAWLQVGARLTPLWHAVELIREVTVGVPSAWPPLGHVAYLVAWTLVGVALSVGMLRRSLVR